MAEPCNDQSMLGETYLISKDMLQDALRTSEGVDLVVETIHFSETVKKGENGLSNLLAVNVTTRADDDQVKEHHLVAKIDFSPKTDIGKFTRECKFYEREIKTYTELFWAMKEHQLQKNIAKPITPSVPYVLTSVLSEENMFLMNDLRQDGYVQADIKVGLNLDQCKLVMNEYAKFHALSYAVKNNSKENLKERFSYYFGETIFRSIFLSKHETAMVAALECSIELIREVVHDKDLLERVDKLRNFNFLEIFQSFLFEEEPFGSLCIRDASCRNLMFKYAHQSPNGKNYPVDVKLLDFQMVCYSMPAIDIAMLMYSSTCPQLRKDHSDDLLQFYHASFKRYLKHLDFDFPQYSYDVLLRHFDKARKIGIYCGLAWLPYLTMEPEDFPTLSGTGYVIGAQTCLQSLRKHGRQSRITDLFFEAVKVGML